MTRLEKLNKLAEEISELSDKLNHIDYGPVEPGKSPYEWTENDFKVLDELQEKAVEFQKESQLFLENPPRFPTFGR